MATDGSDDADRARRLLTNSAGLTVTVAAVSATNYGLNVGLARLLPPAQFGDANLAVNIVLMSAAIAAMLQLVTSRSVAAHPDDDDRIRRSMTRHAIRFGVPVALMMAFGSGVLANALSTSSPWLFAIIGVGLPWYFVQAVQRGVLQGRRSMGRLAASYLAEAVVRLVGALALVSIGLGPDGAALAISLSFVASLAVTRVPRGDGATSDSTSNGAGEGLRAALTTSAVLLSGQVLITNGDIIVSKLRFTPDRAGAYAAVALFGRALFFLSTAVVQAMFPEMADADASPSRRRAVRRTGILFVSLLCGAGIATLALAGPELAPVLVGDGYATGFRLIVPYAIATSMFAVANLLATLDMAAGRRDGAVVLLAGSLLQLALVIIVGSTPESLVAAQIAAMAVTLAVMAVVTGRSRTGE